MKMPEYFKPLEVPSANVIWTACNREVDVYVLFRKKFHAPGGECSIKLFANTYYNLYIDGSFIHRGPVRRTEPNLSMIS